MLKINKAIPTDTKGEVGVVSQISASGDGYILIGTGEGSLKVLSVIPEGKGKMSAGDFVRGRKIQVGDKVL
jgi:methionyl-tRNA formyltransferase